MEAMGIIFSNVFDSHMGVLTEQRTSGAIPFGGRYRQIDFPLSNMANSSIRRIGIITKTHYQSLLHHIGSCQEWDLNLSEKGVTLVSPYSTGEVGVYRGKLDAIYSALNVLERSTQDYVVISDSSVLCAINYAEVLEQHVKSGCDVTILAKAGKANGKERYDLAMRLNAEGRIEDLAVNYCAPKNCLVSMGMFVISRRLLINVVRDMVPRGKYHFEQDFLLNQYNQGEIRINVFPFDGIALFNESTTDYYENSLSLLDESVRRNLFHGAVPIYTKVRDEVPTHYGDKADIRDCLVADGCTLNGGAKRSILFREVAIEEDAEVEGCVLMPGVRIGVGASVHFAVLDKDVQVRPHSELRGSKSQPIVIKKGAII